MLLFDLKHFKRNLILKNLNLSFEIVNAHKIACEFTETNGLFKTFDSFESKEGHMFGQVWSSLVGFLNDYRSNAIRREFRRENANDPVDYFGSSAKFAKKKF